jgi:hypothetical protein
MTDRELMKMANRIEALAFEMKAPNAHTPQFVMLANEIRARARLAQPEREWQGLTDEEMHECAGEYPWTPTGLKCCRAIEAKLKEKNT